MNASDTHTNQNYNFANILSYKMKITILSILGFLLSLSPTIKAQVKTDTLPVFMADSINAVYIYADTGSALNKMDKEGRKQGLWVKKYDDGHIRYKGHFMDDKPNGVFKNYYDEGDSLEAIRVYSNEGQSAYAHLFYTTGALEAEGNYVGEQRDSIWKFYDELQRLIRKEQYKNGKREGKSVVFYPDNGAVMQVKNWKHDSADGPFEEYYPEGELMEEGTYVNGQLEDTLSIYLLDGKLTRKGRYLHDMHEGMWIDYNDGEPKDTLIYHRGNCLNCSKYTPTKKQEDSLKLQNQEIQQRLDHPTDDMEDQTPSDGEH